MGPYQVRSHIPFRWPQQHVLSSLYPWNGCEHGDSRKTIQGQREGSSSLVNGRHVLCMSAFNKRICCTLRSPAPTPSAVQRTTLMLYQVSRTLCPSPPPHFHLCPAQHCFDHHSSVTLVFLMKLDAKFVIGPNSIFKLLSLHLSKLTITPQHFSYSWNLQTALFLFLLFLH